MTALGSVRRGLATAGLSFAVLTGCGAATQRVSANARTSAAATRARRATTTPTTTTTTTTAATTTTARTSSQPHLPAYPVLSQLRTPGSQWRAVVSVAGRTAVWMTQRGGVTMLRFDQRVARLVLHAGSVDPGGGPWRHGTSIVGSERRQLIAAFNSGFRLDTGAGGWRSGTRTAVPLAPGRASVVTYRDGVTDIGAWGAGVPARQPVASVRQNLYLLVDHGVAASDASSCIETCWGATIGGVLSVARSALGIDTHGRLIYGAAESATPASLAQGLIEGGVRRAAELDINPDWVAAYLYRHQRHGPPRYVPAIPGQYGVYGQFLLPYSRDFFAVVAR
jgi:hypothetical protein